VQYGSLVVLALAFVVAACVPPPAEPPPVAPPTTAGPTAAHRAGNTSDVILATTTSTQDSGLLDVLVPLFERQAGYRVKTVSVGTGAALALGARGEADVVLVHAPDAEKQWMAQGNGTERLLVMHNDFVVVGPDDDPASIRGAHVAVDALKKIAASGAAPFISRGDNSGTQQLELALWRQAAISPQGQPWYVESGTGMAQTLTIADQKRAYTIADRATWLTQRSRLQLPILVEGDQALFNVYHVMPVNPARFPGVPINVAGGKAFADFMVAPATQEVIGAFGRQQHGESLFIPDAGKRDEDLGL
jgi:tungstate transport system substrate-binding protein